MTRTPPQPLQPFDGETPEQSAWRERWNEWTKTPPRKDESVYGTRRVVRFGNCWRVVCSQCRGGESLNFWTRSIAVRAAVRDMDKPCQQPGCG